MVFSFGAYLARLFKNKLILYIYDDLSKIINRKINSRDSELSKYRNGLTLGLWGQDFEVQLLHSLYDIICTN